MASILSAISVFFIPGIVTIIIVYGLYQKAPLYDLFVEGAKDGLKTAAEILPFIVAIFVGIEAVVSSGAMDFFQRFLGPVFELFGIPRELVSLVLLRPVSGSGSLVLVQHLLDEFGADGFLGRAATVMAGSCETVFYVLALYFGMTAVKKMRHAFSVGVIGYLVGVFASLAICRLL